MGYIKKVVETGVEFADKYEVTGYVAKARGSSKLIDAASEKIEFLYCEKGSPLLDTLDELTAAKINTALAIANSKVEQAHNLKNAAAGKVTEKKTEAIEMAKQTKEEGIKKYTALKIEASKKVDATKTIMKKQYNHVTEEAVILGQKVEKKLEQSEYGNKVLSVVMKAKEQVYYYGEALVQKSLSLPLTLQERMEKGLSLANEQVAVGTTAFKAKKAEFVSLAVMKYEKITSENVLETFRTVFGDNAATKAEDFLQNLKEAKVSQQLTDKMKGMYAYSTDQVGRFAKIAEEMEAKNFGTTFVFRARAKFTRK
jgi:hypothetical protein